MSTQKPYSFRGRIRPKPEQPNMLQMVELLHQRMSFIYKRLSSHEQVKKSIFSIQMQDGLEELAREDGYNAPRTKEEIKAIKSDPNYPGWYIDGSVIVEERDLGISGTLGQEDREGLAHLILTIENDETESIYVVHISRLFRDQTLIDGLSFGELCKEHNVIIVMPNMRLNLRDKMHMRIYRMELERAADELEIMKLRMGGTRQLKAKQGYYAAGAVAVGYYINKEKQSKDYDRPVIYQPHASIITRIAQLAQELNYSPLLVARRMRKEEEIYIPPFPSELQYMETRSATKLMKMVDGKGFLISPKFVARVLTNPIYIGWWVWGGEVVNKNNHTPILDEDTFWMIQDRFASRKTRGRAVYHEPYTLEGLLWCVSENHEGLIAHVSTDKFDERYRCHGGYELGTEDHHCFSTIKRVLDGPLSEFVVSQCAYSKYADELIIHLKNSYDEAREKAETSKRDLARLDKEIDTLKQNLAYTKTREQAEMLLEMIEARRAEKTRLSQIEAYPAGRVGKKVRLDQENIDKVKGFLQSIRTIWDEQPSGFKNEFLSIILDKIIIRPERSRFRLSIIWATGHQQEILIHRPHFSSSPENKWTADEVRTLKEKYPAAAWHEIFDGLPRKSISAILTKAKKLGLLSQRERGDDEERTRCDWTPEEDILLTDAITGKIKLSLGELIARLRRHPSGIPFRIKKMGLVEKPEPIQNIEWEVVSWGKEDDGDGDRPDSDNGNNGDKGRGDLVAAELATDRSLTVGSSNGFQGQHF